MGEYAVDVIELRRCDGSLGLCHVDCIRNAGLEALAGLARGVAIMAALQGRLSGIALPRLVCDTPGGRGKVPLGPDYVVSRGPGTTTLRTFRGETVDYVDPPDCAGSG